MAISKIVDNRSYDPKPDDSASCMKGSTDCQYLTESGGCSAEWCIYEELPKMIRSSKTLTCSICGENKKSFSYYSGKRDFICDECNQKIKKVTPDKRLCSVCKTNQISTDQYICTDCQKDLVTSISNKTCAVCGTSISFNEAVCSDCRKDLSTSISSKTCAICGTSIAFNKAICSSCSTKIKEKINEPTSND